MNKHFHIHGNKGGDAGLLRKVLFCKPNKKMLYFIALLSLLVCFALYYQMLEKEEFIYIDEEAQRISVEEGHTLFYLASMEWGKFPSELAMKYNCGNNITTEWTHNKSRAIGAAGIIFFGATISGKHQFVPLRANLDSVVKVYMSLESLGSYYSDCLRYPRCIGYFNWSIGAAEGVNDIVVKYFSKDKFDDFYKREIANPFDPVALMETKRANPDKVVSWLCSSCLPRSRHKYMARFMQHIHVDSYGQCHNNMQIPKGGGRWEDGAMEIKLEILPKYKFYMVLENFNCRGYISEKAFQCLATGVVPIYMGHESTYHLLPPGSFINGRDFKTTKELADYLIYLNNNDDEYLKYFKWRQDIKVIEAWGKNFDNIKFSNVACHLHNKYMDFYKNMTAYPKQNLDKVIDPKDLVCHDFYDKIK